MSLTVDIKKRIGNFVLDVSFEAEKGVSGLLGASGSGKSMTLMCIAGIVKPDSGKIVLNGRTLFDSERSINIKPQQRRVGYLFQNYALFPNMTVRQNILCGLHSEKNKSEREAKLAEILEIMQLRGYENRRPSQLSGGQQQRVALGRILIGNPELLVLDEPFSALDSHLRGQLQIETQKLLRRFGKSAILVTHNRDEAYQLCNDIALVVSGTIIAHKNTKQLFEDPESCQAAILTGCKNVVSAKKAGDFLVDVPEWGVQFATSTPIGDNLCAIGIRAYHFSPKISQNNFPVMISGEIEGFVEYSVQFRYNKQAGTANDVWWQVSKAEKSASVTECIGVNPADIMLLYK